MRIDHVHAREVLDSRGRPTVEVEVSVGSHVGRAIVPSGASTGQWEALELRDSNDAWYSGRSVRGAVRNVIDVLGPAVVGTDPCDQAALDETLCALDGTPAKSRLGANAILGISLANARAAASALGLRFDQHLCQLWEKLRVSAVSSPTAALPPLKHPAPSLPLPMVNMISGGLHAGGYLDFQDFLAIPVGAPRYSVALEWIVRIYNALGKCLSQAAYEGVLVGDEGGYGPRLDSPVTACRILVQAIREAGLEPERQVCLGLDVASSHFYHEDGYHVRFGDEKRVLSSAGMVELLVDMVKEFPIISIEDGVAENDAEGWRLLTEKLRDHCQLIGDDLFVTNPTRLRTGIEQGVANSVLVKLNQVGSLTETLETTRLALDHGYWPVISARSGETEDSTIADLAVATGAGQIKIGSVARSERLAKYNQLLRLEEWLGDRTHFHSGAIFSRLT